MSQLNLYPNASTIDAVNDELVIWTNSLSAVQNINRNTFLNLSSQPVGLTDSQTLTNKTLTSPTVSSPTFSGTLAGTYTIGGTPTFPASVTQNTVSQTLTNKTLTSPTITSPTITNATISADTLTGYTVSNTGTVYGINVTTGNVSMSGTLAVTGTLSSGAITSSGIIKASSSNPVWQYLGYAQITSDFTTTNTSATQITSLTVTATVPGGYTKVRVTVYSADLQNATSGDGAVLTAWSGTVGSGTQIGQFNVATTSTSQNQGANLVTICSPSTGSITFNAGLSAVTGGTARFGASSTSPAFILVECC